MIPAGWRRITDGYAPASAWAICTAWQDLAGRQCGRPHSRGGQLGPMGRSGGGEIRVWAAAGLPGPAVPATGQYFHIVFVPLDCLGRDALGGLGLGGRRCGRVMAGVGFGARGDGVGYAGGAGPTGARGWPDLAPARGGVLRFRELKSAKGRLAAAQQAWLQALQEAGRDAAVWRPADWNEIERTLKC